MSVVEEWRPISGFPGYEVSSLGRVASRLRRRPLILKGHVTPKGYRFVHLRAEGRAHPKAVHRLVALTFLGPRPEGQEIRHLDGDSLNNDVRNLAFGTRAQNVADSLSHGTHPSRLPRCRLNHLLVGANILRDEAGEIWCRRCTAIRAAWEECRVAAP